jgi:hypothetical protein
VRPSCTTDAATPAVRVYWHASNRRHLRFSLCRIVDTYTSMDRLHQTPRWFKFHGVKMARLSYATF